MLSLGTRLIAALLLMLGTVAASPANAATKPPAPKSVKVVPTHDSATVTWKPSTGATSYSVCLTSSGKTSRCAHAARRVRGTTATIKGLKPTGGTDWFVRVRAANAGGYADARKIAMNLKAKPARPSAPTSVKVAPTHDAATVTWRRSARATSYSVCLTSSSSATTCTHAARRVRGTSATIKNLKPTGGTDWYVRVRAANAGGYADARKIAMNLTAKPAPTPPAPKAPHAPSGVEVVPTHSSVTVTWNPSPGATSYSVCLMTNGTTTTCAHTARPGTATTATITGLVPTGGTDYYVRVRATNSIGYADAATIAMNLAPKPTTPPAPTNVKVVPTYDSATVTWNPSPGATSYSVCLMTNGTTTTCAYTARPGTATTATITGLVPTGGTDYYVRVRATNAAGSSDAATIAMNLPPDTRPAEPTDVTVMTYNLCGQDKCVSSTNQMKLWSTRKSLAGAWVRAGGADIIATQESHDRDTKFGTELPGFGVAAYYSAKTLFYDTSKYTVLGSGHITLNQAERKYAVWAEFKDKQQRTRFIVIDAHLQPYKGKRQDDMRYAQSNLLIKEIAKKNPARLPVVYAGDFNSNESNASPKYPGGYDGAAKSFTQARIPDSIDAVPDAERQQPDWNSSNQAKNPPMRYGDHIDKIYVDPRVTVNQWTMMVRVSAGKYTTPFATDHNPLRVKLTIPAT